LWYFETLLDTNQTANAEAGFYGIRNKANKQTRLYLEASFFLAICYLRQKRIREAKPLLRGVLAGLNKEQTAPTRQFLQKRIIERIEEESILVELIGTGCGELKEKQIQDLTVELVKLTEDEVLDLLGRNIPYEAFKLLQDMRADAILQLSVPDRKLLPAPGFATGERAVGKRAFAVLKRIGWKTLCDSKSPLYVLWAKNVKEVYSTSYFSAAIVQAFNNWRIGIPFLAAGVSAIAMRYAAEEFCLSTKPDSIMEIRRKKT
jgi:hypothetical protein